RGAGGRRRFCRPRAHGPLLPRAAGRLVDDRPASGEADLPHFQRLHHRPPQRPRLRLLSARSILQTVPHAPGGAPHQDGEAVGFAAVGLLLVLVLVLVPCRLSSTSTSTSTTPESLDPIQ